MVSCDLSCQIPHGFPVALVEPGIPQIAAHHGELGNSHPPEAIGHWNQKPDLIIRNQAHFTIKDYRFLLTFEGQFPDPQLLKFRIAHHGK
jgi:hypothetical protein